jgi:hypothetical protein
MSATCYLRVVGLSHLHCFVAGDLSALTSCFGNRKQEKEVSPWHSDKPFVTGDLSRRAILQTTELPAVVTGPQETTMSI